MEISNTIESRFTSLLQKGKALPLEHGHMGDFVSSGPWQNWITSSLNLLRHTLGEESIHFKQLLKLDKKAQGYSSEKDQGIGILEAAKEDIDAGVVTSLEKRISSELFSSFIVSAKQALSEGHKNVAAVLACSALEDTLKKYAALNGLDVDGKTMDSVVGALKGAGLVSGAQKGLLQAMPRIRNAAMHADWDKISEPDVSSVIGFTEQFLLTNLS